MRVVGLHGRRLDACFIGSPGQPTSRFDGANVIQEIIDGSSTKLRNSAGAASAAMINWRQRLKDEDWWLRPRRVGGGGEEEYGLDVKLG